MDTLVPAPDQVAPLADSTSIGRRVIISITSRTIWLAAFVFLGILASLFLLTRALGPLMLLLLAIILGEAIRPLVAYLGRYRIPEPVAVLLIYVVVLGIAGLFLWLFLNPLIAQLGSFSQNIPHYLTQLQQEFSQLERTLRTNGALSHAIDNLSNLLTSALQHALPQLVAVPVGVLSGVFSLLIDLVIILTMTIFWLMASHRLRPFVVGLFPPT